MDGPGLWFGVGGVLFGLVVIVWRAVEQRQTSVRWNRAEEALRTERAEIERERAEIFLEGKETIESLRRELEADHRERRGDIQRAERRIEEKETAVERRLAGLDRREKELTAREQELARASAALEQARRDQEEDLQRIGGLSADEAREILLRRVEEQTRHEQAQIVRSIEEEARRESERRARQIVAEAIERCGTDKVAESAVSVVPLVGDEIKGRIIGREGRNIRTFEQLTGVDLVIDDTPDAVVISAFDPMRREVARLALETLVADGRIHPGRIEEVVERCSARVEQSVVEAGEQATYDTGVVGLSPSLVEILGHLRFRTSYGQNVLQHSVEVCRLAGVMASELGAKVEVAKRAGLLHDVGKAVDAGVDGPHALIGSDLLRRHGEGEAVIHAVEAHHRDREPKTVEAILVAAADAVSAARPGARRDTLETYVQRLAKLEELAGSFPGVDKVYAIQAGREVRILVKPEEVDDEAASLLARGIAAKIEAELAYPGQIKITVIREQRAIEYAK